jgi:hypothetical protein
VFLNFILPLISTSNFYPNLSFETFSLDSSSIPLHMISFCILDMRHEHTLNNIIEVYSVHLTGMFGRRNYKWREDGWLSSGMTHHVVWYTLTDISEVLTVSIIKALMMEAVSTSETSGNIYQTTPHNIPEDSHLHTHCHKNLQPHLQITC